MYKRWQLLLSRPWPHWGEAAPERCSIINLPFYPRAPYLQLRAIGDVHGYSVRDIRGIVRDLHVLRHRHTRYCRSWQLGWDTTRRSACQQNWLNNPCLPPSQPPDTHDICLPCRQKWPDWSACRGHQLLHYFWWLQSIWCANKWCLHPPWQPHSPPQPSPPPPHLPSPSQQKIRQQAPPPLSTPTLTSLPPFRFYSSVSSP